ncbi:MAG: hypothetical protein K9W42_06660 [Candidatus Heimdallarchaeota archaeon]|nr:hypothetical protein [Candidatus Heimdallarchaeota archaeon]
MILRTSLIGKSGKFIAGTPKEMDIKQQLLTSGLISAILEFSKSVNQQEIQSIKFQNHTTSFVDLQEFFLIVDLADDIESKAKEQLLKNLQKNAQELLKNRTEEDVSLGEGDLILEEILNGTIPSFFGLKGQSFFKKKIGTFTIFHKKIGFETANVRNKKVFAENLAAVIDKGLKGLPPLGSEELLTAFLPDRIKGATYYLTLTKKENKSRVWTLETTYSNSMELFKQKRLLDKRLRELRRKKPKLTINKLLAELNEGEIPQTKKKFDPEYFSLNFLDKNVKNIERAIFPLVTDAPVLVVGERPAVKIVINTLLIFTQHLLPDVIEWLTTENTIALNITGMAAEKYAVMKEEGLIDKHITTINLDEGKVYGKETSSYFNKLYTKVKKISPVVAYAVIGNELEKLTKNAIALNELLLLPREKAQEEFAKLKEENTSEARFAKVKKLACSRNPFLEKYLEHLEKGKRESYFEIF